MGDEVGDIIRLGEYQDHLQRSFSGEVSQEVLKLVACLCVESDEGIVHNQYARLFQQGARQLVFACFTAGHQYHILIQQMTDMEELIQVPLHFAAFGSVLSSLEISLFEQLPYGRCLLVYFRLVPSQLQVIRLLGAIRVAEGDVLDIVTHHLLGRR